MRSIDSIPVGAAKIPAGEEILALLDLQRYPIHDPDGLGRHFIEHCCQRMMQQGWCSLEGFIHPQGVEALMDEVNDMLPAATPLTIARNIYGHAADPSLPTGHPGRREFVHHALQLADDQIAANSLIKQLYYSDLLTAFIGRVQGKQQLYRSADEFQAANIVALPPGGWQGWHYDHDECVVTLLLQAAEQGGEFMFLPNCRTSEGEDTETVERLLEGDTSVAKTFPRSPGTLTIFRGEFSLHGVTKIEGSKPRVTAIFTYDERAGRVASDEINVRIYGPRVERILADRKAKTS